MNFKTTSMHNAMKKDASKADGGAVICCNGDCNQGRACPVRLGLAAVPATRGSLLERISNSSRARRAAHQAAQAVVRYCPECGHVGDVSKEHRNCCPDGSSAFMVPEKYAQELRAGFKALLAAAVTQAALAAHKGE